MNDLSARDRELVALGAALGSNCVPCVEFHIPEARKAGLSDEAIRAAIEHADKIRQVPARQTLQAALGKLASATADAGNAGTSPESCCGGDPGASSAAHPVGDMVGVMAKMMATRCGSAHPGDAPKPAEAVTPASEGCGRS